MSEEHGLGSSGYVMKENSLIISPDRLREALASSDEGGSVTVKAEDGTEVIMNRTDAEKLLKS
jgi:hypothetical protein